MGQVDRQDRHALKKDLEIVEDLLRCITVARLEVHRVLRVDQRMTAFHDEENVDLIRVQGRVGVRLAEDVEDGGGAKIKIEGFGFREVLKCLRLGGYDVIEDVQGQFDLRIRLEIAAEIFHRLSEKTFHAIQYRPDEDGALHRQQL